MNFGGASQSGLLKEQLATKLREEILQGRLAPGDLIIENRWAKRLAVGQTSVREAINILVADGFVEKLSGQSARVTQFTVEDLDQIQVLRSRLEGLAVRLLTEQQADLADLELAYADMAAAAQCANMRTLIDRDLRFHLLLFEKTGNRFLLDAARRILVPLFAFTLVRVLAKGAGPQSFIDGLADHEQILEVIRKGDPEAAERYAAQALRRFARLGRDAFMEGPAQNGRPLPQEPLKS